jgi:hypothetical protein
VYAVIFFAKSRRIGGVIQGCKYPKKVYIFGRKCPKKGFTLRSK